MSFFWRKRSNSFCVYPLIEQVALPTGTVGFCCVAKDGGPVKKRDGSFHKLPDDSLEKAWNSDFLKKLRKDQAEGKPVKNCELCYYQESIGKLSYRQMHNKEWTEKFPLEIRKRIKEVSQGDGHLSSGPMYLDLRLGNLCNLKCRMCNPYNSSKIESEYRGLMESDPEFHDFYKANHGGHLPGITKWFEDDRFWNDVEKAIPSLRKVYLTGGEPTLIKKNQWFLNKCIETGNAKNMDLMFNINATHLKEEFLQSISQFKFVLVNVSVDGVGPVNDYIRSGSKWEVVQENIKRLLTLPENVRVGLTPVVQIYNIFYLGELIDFANGLYREFKKNINVDFLYATDPKYLDIRYLPRGIKQQAKNRLGDAIAGNQLYHKNSYLKNSVNSCLRALDQDQPEDSKENLKQFLMFTRLMDKSRGESWKQTLPALYNVFESEEVL